MNMNLRETWRRAAQIKTFILGFSYNSFQNVVRVLPTFFDWLRRLDPSLFNSSVAYKRDFFRNMASKNSQETLGVRNAFSYIDIGMGRKFEKKAILKFNSSVCDYKSNK